MADLYFYHEDDADDGDGGYGDTDATISPDEPPVSKLEKYADSGNIFNRQIVARTILETLRVVTDDPQDVQSVLNVMNKLADDVEPNVRAELMEQVPHIAMYCQEYKLKLSHVVAQFLLPMVVKFLTDENNQVRKTSQAALLVLLEQGLVERLDVKDQVCPVIIKLTEEKSRDDYRTEAVALLSKMAPLIGKEMSEQIFLERFAALCLDPLFHVRGVCAANFGDFSTVVGAESTENVLLPKFFYLCEDGVWGVRKACADAFMPVSCVCSPAVRHAELSPLFINLLRDESRWVKVAAYQALGHFISTFADNAITGLLHNDNGEIVITDPQLLAQRLDELEQQRATEKEVEQAAPSSSVSKLTAQTSAQEETAAAAKENTIPVINEEQTTTTLTSSTSISNSQQQESEVTSSIDAVTSEVTSQPLEEEEEKVEVDDVKEEQVAAIVQVTTTEVEGKDEDGDKKEEVVVEEESSHEPETLSTSGPPASEERLKEGEGGPEVIEPAATEATAATATSPEGEKESGGCEEKEEGSSSSSVEGTAAEGESVVSIETVILEEVGSSALSSSPKEETAADEEDVLMDVDEEETDEGDSNKKEEETKEQLMVSSLSDDVSPEELRAKSYVNSNKSGGEKIQDGGDQKKSSESTDEFNDFQFWRDPIPKIEDLTISGISSQSEGVDDQQVVDCLTGRGGQSSIATPETEVHVVAESSEGHDDDLMIQPLHEDDEEDEEAKQLTAASESNRVELNLRPSYHNSSSNDSSTISTFDPYETYKKQQQQQPATGNSSSSAAAAAWVDMQQQQQLQDPALPKGPPLTVQSIVPQLLVDHYVSMTDPSRVQTVDNEIAKHCAYSLPAVALTLGRSNWPLLKDTYETLAKDMQWKVRRTLASSIHELGIILGDEAQDLIPIFNGFLEDLDEVRIGLLKHLADFLKLLKQNNRREYLPRLSEFLEMDNDRNWRFRQELAEQLCHLVDLYTPAEVKEHLCPIAQVLVRDKVAAVRLSAVEAHTVILRHLQQQQQQQQQNSSSQNDDDDDDENSANGLAKELMSELGASLGDRWVHRQTYATLCFRVFTAQVMEGQQYAEEVLPYLIQMAWDKVPNVRLVVARSLYNINQASFFCNEDFVNCERFREAISFLAGDRDKDVRAFFNPVHAPSTPSDFYDSDGEPIGDVSSLPV